MQRLTVGAVVASITVMGIGVGTTSASALAPAAPLPVASTAQTIAGALGCSKFKAEPTVDPDAGVRAASQGDCTLAGTRYSIVAYSTKTKLAKQSAALEQVMLSFGAVLEAGAGASWIVNTKNPDLGLLPDPMQTAVTKVGGRVRTFGLGRL